MPIQYSPLFGTPLTTTITADTTLSGLHHVVLCNNSSDITVTLPAAATYPYRSYFIKKIGSNANIVTIDGNASETIDGSTTVVLYVQYDFLEIASDGSNWHILSDGMRKHKAQLSDSTGQSLTNNAISKMAFDTEDFDIGGIASTSTDKITIRRAGKYLVIASWTGGSSFVAGTVVAVYIYKNGSSSLAIQQAEASGDQSVIMTEIMDLAAADELEMYYFQNSGTETANTLLYRPRIYVSEIRP